jgi:cysteine-S-conjugate beta-lyase
MTDIPAIAEIAHARGALVIDDNTWATALFHRSLDQGVDISMQAATKYIGGHSDIMFGTISANAKAWPLLAEGIRLLGVCAGPHDVFLALRGTRTLSVRLAQHYRSGLEMARWLATRPEVLEVWHPALESHPGHAIWKRDFTGATGLFSIVLKPVPQKAVDALLDTVKLFGMGVSWGGFESLIIPFDCNPYRTATKWSPGGPTLRLHIGLENVDDLKADLDRGFAALKAAAQGFSRPPIKDCPRLPRHAGVLPHPTGPCGRSLSRAVATGFLRRAANYPFTMTVNPAVRSTKNFTHQVPLYL